MTRLFPGVETRVIPYDHPLYKSFYDIERVRSLHRNVDVYFEGLFYEGLKQYFQFNSPLPHRITL